MKTVLVLALATATFTASTNAGAETKHAADTAPQAQIIELDKQGWDATSPCSTKMRSS